MKRKGILALAPMRQSMSSISIVTCIFGHYSKFRLLNDAVYSINVGI